MLVIKDNVSITDLSNNNYHCVYTDLSFNLVCFYEEEKFKKFNNDLININYSYELSLRKKDIDKNKKKILLWMT